MQDARFQLKLLKATSRLARRRQDNIAQHNEDYVLIMFNADDFDLIIQFPDRKKKKMKMDIQMEMDFRNKNFSFFHCLLPSQYTYTFHFVF